jgi:hypothetical protein
MEDEEEEKDLFSIDRSVAYSRCPVWKAAWDQANNGPGWPESFQKVDNKLIEGTFWCIPRDLTAKALKELHSEGGHLGGDRLVDAAKRRYKFADSEEMARMAQRVQKHCHYCQATQHPHQPLKLKVHPTPIPPFIMASVAIDLFVMPEVHWEDKTYNVFAACVDRHSGWAVATPHHTRGLTAATVAKEMYNKWWSPHGIPSVITSDRGPHFAGAWWRTLYALHGVRHAYAQAHHHAANGRAEVLGSQIQQRLRSEKAEAGTTWVEALQKVVQQMNDSPARHGLSPYEVLYGRHRWTAGVPYKAPTMMEDAVEFFARQRKVDEHVATTLNKLHQTQSDLINRRRKELSEFKAGDRVWYLRPPRRAGEKLESYWLGPAVVLEGRGQSSYLIQLEETRQQEVHRCQLKECFTDEALLGKPIKLFKFRQAKPEEAVGITEWNVEEILRHRQRDDGDLEFEVRWEGSPDLTREPIEHFFHRFSMFIVEYFKKRKLRVDVMDYLHRHAAETEVAAVLRSMELEWEDPPPQWQWEDTEEEINTHDLDPNTEEGEFDKTAPSPSSPTTSSAAQTAAHNIPQDAKGQKTRRSDAIPTRDPPPALGQGPPRITAHVHHIPNSPVSVPVSAVSVSVPIPHSLTLPHHSHPYTHNPYSLHHFPSSPEHPTECTPCACRGAGASPNHSGSLPAHLCDLPLDPRQRESATAGACALNPSTGTVRPGSCPTNPGSHPSTCCGYTCQPGVGGKACCQIVMGSGVGATPRTPSCCPGCVQQCSHQLNVRQFFSAVRAGEGVCGAQ